MTTAELCPVTSVWTIGADCSGTACPIGACCLPSGTCESPTTLAHCEALGGTWNENENCATSSCPTTIHVDADAPPGGSGTSWPDAFASLQHALSAASQRSGVVEVWVAEGVYRPTTDGDRRATFRLRSGVGLFGGFQGNGRPGGGERLRAERDPRAHETVLSGEVGAPGPADNSYNVVTGSGVDPTAVLDGFTIRDGNADGPDPYWVGGGLVNLAGSPTVRNCAFIRNAAAEAGAAIYTIDGGLTVSECLFRDNRVTGRFGVAGAVRNYRTRARLSNCAFVSNVATGEFGEGGAIHNAGGSTVTMEHCTVRANHANRLGGGVRCVDGVLTAVNSVFWANTDAAGTNADAAAQIRTGDAAVSVRHCCVQAWPTSGVDGNISADPAFAGPDDARLRSGSPCIDAADAAWTTSPTDLDARARRMDDPLTPDAGLGACPLADMGAYEFRRLCEPNACPRGDANEDGVIDGRDVAAIVRCMADPVAACACPCLDMNLDGRLDADSDVPCFVNLLLGTPDCVTPCR